MTAGDLEALAGALASVETAIDDLQTRIARAEAPPPAGNGGPQPATFDALTESLRAQDRGRPRAGTPARAPARPHRAGRQRRRRRAPEPPTPVGERPRTFLLTNPRMSGNDVKAFSDALNRRFDAWGVHKRIVEIGTYGPETRQRRDVRFDDRNSRQDTARLPLCATSGAKSTSQRCPWPRE